MRNIVATGDMYGEAATLKQISKHAAKKAFAKGEEIFLQSSNMYPFGMWQNAYPVNFDKEALQSDIRHNNFCIALYSDEVNLCRTSNEDWRKNMLAEYEEKLKQHTSKVINSDTQFEQILNSYSCYNCDSERGKYINFYIKVS